MVFKSLRNQLHLLLDFKGHINALPTQQYVIPCRFAEYDRDICSVSFKPNDPNVVAVLNTASNISHDFVYVLLQSTIFSDTDRRIGAAGYLDVVCVCQPTPLMRLADNQTAPVLRAGQVWGLDLTVTDFHAPVTHPLSEKTVEILESKIIALGGICRTIISSENPRAPTPTHVGVLCMVYDFHSSGNRRALIHVGLTVQRCAAIVSREDIPRSIFADQLKWPPPYEWCNEKVVPNCSLDKFRSKVKRHAFEIEQEGSGISHSCIYLNSFVKEVVRAFKASNEHRFYSIFKAQYALMNEGQQPMMFYQKGRPYQPVRVLEKLYCRQ